MRAPRTVLRRGLPALGFAAALLFGANAAVAGPAAARQVCTDPSAEGTCASQSDCRKICNRLSNGLIPFCDTASSCCDCQKL